MVVQALANLTGGFLDYRVRGVTKPRNAVLVIAVKEQLRPQAADELHPAVYVRVKWTRFIKASLRA